MPDDKDKQTEDSRQFGLVSPAPRGEPEARPRKAKPAKAIPKRPERGLGASVGKLLKEALRGLGGS